MKNFTKKKKIIIAAVSSILVLTCVIGVTLALLRTQSEPVTNKFAGKDAAVNIGVVEQGTVYEDGKNTVTYDKDVQSPVEKKVSIKNNHKPDYVTSNTWIRARLVPIIRDDNSGEIAPVSVDQSKLSYTYGGEVNNSTDTIEAGKWLKKAVSGEAYYYYSTPVSPNKTTGELITAVQYTGEIPDGTHLELQVLAEGISAVQDGAVASAWGNDIAELLKIQ